jgi:protein-L-isoaspartate(D-aspartate) O-methyltransferase
MKNTTAGVILTTILLTGIGDATVVSFAAAQGITPRTSQTQHARYVRAIALAVAVVNQPKSNRARRAAMVKTIRDSVAAARSKIDMAELDRTLLAIGQIARERFVPAQGRDFAYIQTPFPIGYEQTISDSYIVAVMTAAVRPRSGDTVLDIGTGSGYQAAVLSRLTRSVVSIEIVPQLAAQAANRLQKLGYRNVSVSAGDGFAGAPTRAPFDAIIVAAGATAIPPPLLDQLKPGGRLVMPIGPTQFEEQLILVSKSSDGVLTHCSLGPAAFVPFTGQAIENQSSVRQSGEGVPFCYGAAVTYGTIAVP